MKTPPYNPKPRATNRKMEAASSRFLSTRKVTTGCLVRDESSHQTMRTRQTPERIANRSIHWSENQSFEFPSSRTHCSEPIPTVSSVIPSQSTSPRCLVWSGGSLRNVLTRKAEMIPMGTLIKKHQLHE